MNLDKSPSSKEVQLISAVMSVHDRTEKLAGAVFQTGMMIDFLMESIITAKREDGTPLIPIDMSKYQDFFDERIKQLQEAQLKTVTSGINLDE